MVRCDFCVLFWSRFLWVQCMIQRCCCRSVWRWLDKRLKIEGSYRWAGNFSFVGSLNSLRLVEKLWFAGFPTSPLLISFNKSWSHFFSYFVPSSLPGNRFRGIRFHFLVRSWNASLLETNKGQVTSSLVLINTLSLAPPSLWTSFPVLPLFLSWFSSTVNTSGTSRSITP